MDIVMKIALLLPFLLAGMSACSQNAPIAKLAFVTAVNGENHIRFFLQIGP